MESVATRSEGELVIHIVRKEGLDHTTDRLSPWEKINHRLLALL